MKKFLLILCTVFLMFCVLAVPAAAETKDDINNAIEQNIPQEFKQLYNTQIENILSQIDLSSEQCANLVTLIEDSSKVINLSSKQLSEYAAEEKAVVLDVLDKASSIMNVQYSYTKSKDISGNVVYSVDVATTAQSGEAPKKLASINGSSLIKKTDVPEKASANFFIPVIAVIFAAAALFAWRKCSRYCD